MSWWDETDTRIVRGYAYLVYRDEVSKYRACVDLCYFLKRTWSSVYSKLLRELKTCA